MKNRILVALPVLVAVLAYAVLVVLGLAPWQVLPALVIAVVAVAVVAIVRAPRQPGGR